MMEDPRCYGAYMIIKGGERTADASESVKNNEL